MTKLSAGVVAAVLSVPAPVSAGTFESNYEHSSNWSGYAIQGGPFTSISGTFTVPDAQSAPCNDNLGEWVGIDGYKNSDLIQAGIGESVTFSSDGSCDEVTVNAWWEILPSAEVVVPLVVSAGDSVTVDIDKLSTGNEWAVSIINNTTGQSWWQDFPYGGPAKSGEWIVEAPSLGFFDITTILPYGSTQFSALRLSGRAALMDDVWLRQNSQWESVPQWQPSARALMTDGFEVVYTGGNPAVKGGQ